MAQIHVQLQNEDQRQIVLDALRSKGLIIAIDEDDNPEVATFVVLNRMNSKLDNLGQLRLIGDLVRSIRGVGENIGKYVGLRHQQDHDRLHVNLRYYRSLVYARYGRDIDYTKLPLRVRQPAGIETLTYDEIPRFAELVFAEHEDTRPE